MAGQINLNSSFGKKIYKIAAIKQFKSFVEIGTWNGEGSTSCFMRSLLNRRDNSRLYSLESDKEMYEIARRFWDSKLGKKKKSKLNLIYGRIIEENELPSATQIMSSPDFFKEHFDLWYERDKNGYRNSPNVLNLLPKDIDVLLLDGGAYSTYSEYRKLKDRTRVIILDDAKTSKSGRIREELLNDPLWHTIIDLPNERQGIYIGSRIMYKDIVSTAARLTMTEALSRALDMLRRAGRLVKNEIKEFLNPIH